MGIELSRMFGEYFKCKKGLHFFLIFLVVATAHGEIPKTTFTSAELIDQIKKSENLIHDMQMEVKWYEPETNNKLVDFHWGYENGKEFIEGHKWTGVDREVPTTKIKYAFDGEKLRIFRHSLSVNRTSGAIGGLTPTTFTVYGTPKALLGYSVKQHAQETFGDILSNAEAVTVKGELEDVGGSNCHVIEVTGINDAEQIFDVRAWIDTDRGFRPQKIERYRRLEGHGLWELIDHRIDGIELRRIEGIWFPVAGTRQAFRTEQLPPVGMSEEEFNKAFSHLEPSERKKHMRVQITPRHPKRRIEVDIKTIKINKGIDPKQFTVDFPIGCRIWDDFTQVGYRVGPAGETVDDVANTEVEQDGSWKVGVPLTLVLAVLVILGFRIAKRLKTNPTETKSF